MRPAPAVLCALLLLAGCAADGSDVDIYALLLERMPSGEAPPFSLLTVDGVLLDNSALAGKPYVIKAFAPSCAPCSEEIPGLLAVDSRFGDDVAIVLVDIETEDTPADVAGFREEAGGGDWHWAVAPAEMLLGYGLMVAGTTLVVDGNGRIVYRDPGHQNPEVVLAAVEQALAAAP